MRDSPRHFYEFGQFRLDADRHRLLRDGEVVHLSPKAIDALLVLVKAPGKLLEREALMQAVWADTFVEDANLTVAISHLRKALGQNGEPAEYIETVPRVGYRFVADVREVSEEPVPLIVEKHTLSRTVIEEELIQDEPHGRAKAEAIVAPKAISQPLPALLRRPVTALLLTIMTSAALVLGAVLLFRGERPTTTDLAAIRLIRSIAVLPPEPLSGEADNASLSLGIADALITRLGGLHKIAVRPISSVVHHVGTNQDSVNTGRTLGVDAVIDGTLQRDNGRVRVTLRLVSVANGEQLWAANFDEANSDIFELQDSVAQQTAAALFKDLSQDEKALLSKQQTANPEAYRLYLTGNYFWSKRGSEAGKSAEYFRRAIELDPNFAQAYVQLAAVDATSANPSPESEGLIEKALQLDNSLAEAHATYGFIRMFHHWDWVTAERELDRAIELNPNSSTAHHWKGVYWSLRGRFNEAKAEMQRALDLDPLSLIILADLGQVHYFAHEYDQAIEYCNRALALDGQFFVAHEYLIDIYRMKGMDQEGLKEFGKLNPNISLEKLRSVFARDGWRGIYKPQIESLLVSKIDGWPLALARAYVRIGDDDQAIRWLGEAVDRPRWFWQPYINADPLYDPLRSDPRFTEIVHRMGL